MKIDMEYVKKNSGRWALYGARLGLASALAIFAAHLMGLQFETQAGVICIFSMLTTSKDTLKLSLSRLISFVFSEMMGWGAALSANVVAGTHFLSVAEFTPHVILNEFFIVLTGMFFALIFNLIRDTNTQKDFLREEILAIQSKMQLILTGIADYIESGTKSQKIWDELEQVHKRLDSCIHTALEYQGNQFGEDAEYYYRYFEMREHQCQILTNLQSELEKIRTTPAQAKIIVDYIRYMSRYVTEMNMPGQQLTQLNVLFSHMEEEPLPKSREEFENRAILYHVLMDLEDFLMVKYKYLEEEGDELPDF